MASFDMTFGSHDLVDIILVDMTLVEVILADMTSVGKKWLR